ncbi:glycoside hydrolase family protein [Neorhodopirellula lusitana]|nr:glycoside hydrolase family protein [Neorhodopirellula lusitana]
MNRQRYLTLVLLVGCVAVSLSAHLHADDVARPRPAEWNNLVLGGQFKDRFERVKPRGDLTSKAWGGDNVLPRDVLNGIEDPDWSYWGGNAVRGDDGKYHLFVCRWPENAELGHFDYHNSIVIHAVADDPVGPYQYEDTIGHGHNPTLYKTRKGYVIYCVGKFYFSKSLSGPWKHNAFDFHKRERWCVQRRVNFTFAARDDGSYTAISRRGFAWVSPDGFTDWYLVSAESVYPKVEGVFEDPLMWKDDVQYHLIANDWKGRIAYYMRSKDGVHWVTEPGEAYAPGIDRYEDGTAPDWYKYERIRVLQDDHGRAVQAHFAVIDSDKHSDLPNDKHSSKHIIIPLTVERLIEVENEQPITADTREIRVKIQAEDGFDPHTDIDLDSLRFGASQEVSFGRGSRLRKTEKAGRDLVLVFEGQGNGITAENFAGKLQGKTSQGKLLIGWARLPGVSFSEPVLSSLAPKFEYTDEGLEAYVEVQNFGQAKSSQSWVEILVDGKVLASGSVRPMKPFETSLVRLVCDRTLSPASKCDVTVQLKSDGLPTETFTKNITLPSRE